MKYEAYQAHADNMARLSLYTEATLNAMRQPWLELVHAEDRDRLDEALRSAREGETSRVEVRLQHRSGAWRWAEVLLFPRRHASHVKGTNVLISDVTERRVLDERLRDLQKMEALGAMAGGIAHDFNNLLGAIVGSVDLAERKVGPGARRGQRPAAGPQRGPARGGAHAAAAGLQPLPRGAGRAVQPQRGLSRGGGPPAPDPRSPDRHVLPSHHRALGHQR